MYPSPISSLALFQGIVCNIEGLKEALWRPELLGRPKLEGGPDLIGGPHTTFHNVGTLFSWDLGCSEHETPKNGEGFKSFLLRKVNMVEQPWRALSLIRILASSTKKHDHRSFTVRR